MARNSGATGRIAASALLFSLQLLAERAAAFAAAYVAAGGRADLRQALGGLSELQAHLLAAQLAGLGGLGEGDPGPHQQRLDGGDGRFHRLRDLFVGEGVDLAQQQRRPLRLGELVHVGDQLAEVLPAHHLVGRREAALGEVDVHRVDADRGGPAEVVQRAVAGDPVEPRTHVDLALVGPHGVEGGREHLLEHVLGVLLGGQHVPAEGQQARLVARAENLEGGVVAAAGERDQALIGLQAQQRGGPRRPGMLLVCVRAEAST